MNRKTSAAILLIALVTTISSVGAYEAQQYISNSSVQIDNSTVTIDNSTVILDPSNNITGLPSQEPDKLGTPVPTHEPTPTPVPSMEIRWSEVQRNETHLWLQIDTNMPQYITRIYLAVSAGAITADQPMQTPEGLWLFHCSTKPIPTNYWPASYIIEVIQIQQ